MSRRMASNHHKSPVQRLPLEGILYDRLSLSNFIDVEDRALCFYLSRSWSTDFFTQFLNYQLPSKVSISYRIWTLSNFSKLKYQPKGKISLSTQLVDLGGGEKRTRGALKVSVFCKLES